MQDAAELTPGELAEFLLNVAVVRPVFIWGAPGIGKSAIVRDFAGSVGMECVSLLGSQLAPEDIIGVPRIEGGVSRFCPPVQIARTKPYCLFLDELNACSQEVQKAFYSLIADRRIGEYALPEGSVVVGAGNRAQDAAIVRPLSSALINRLVHVQMRASASDWLGWAGRAGIHPLLHDYIGLRPDHLWSKPPTHEAPFSTPRAWHMLSDAMTSYGDAELTTDRLKVLAQGLLTPQHAAALTTFHRQRLRALDLAAIVRGEVGWPEDPSERDVLYFLVGSFRARLVKELPADPRSVGGASRELAMQAKDRLVSLSRISLEMAQLVVAEEEDGTALPDWFMTEIARDLPRLTARAA